MSLIAATSTTLCVTDSVASKRISSADLKKIRLNIKPKALAWSHDNSTIYITSVDTIYSFPNSASLSEGTPIYNAPRGQVLQPVLLSKDIYTLVFAQGASIHLLSLTPKPKIWNTLIGHSTPIISLSLSNDGSLLASASLSGTLCVHNLTHNSLTLLKGLPPVTSNTLKRLTCAFHSHTRTRLLVGCGKILVIFDVTRPSSPIKVIKLQEKDINIPSNSYIIAIASSPFSKPLLAVAFNSGVVALVDLDKDRSLLKVLDVNVPITAMSFTADGTAIALGTESGKLILKGWRSAEEEDQVLVLDEGGNGDRIIALSIQRRIKQARHSFESNMTPSSISKPRPLVELNNTGFSGRHAKSPSPTESKLRAKRSASNKSSLQQKLILSPVDINKNEAKKGFNQPFDTISDIENKPPPLPLSRPNSRSTTATKPTIARIVLPPRSHSRAESNNSPIPSKVNTKSSNPGSHRAKKSSSESLQTQDKYNPTSAKRLGGNIQATEASTSKLETQNIRSTKIKGSNVVPQSTPSHEMDPGVTAIVKKEKQVGWSTVGSTKHVKLSGTSSSREDLPSENKPGDRLCTPIEGPIVPTNPEELMRGFIMDMMHEYQRELREDIKGLHLDVLRMGRAWKTELKSLMEEHTQDLKALAEDNAKLRKENDELRRRL
ncbi:hypothetical protein Clacol_006652 [Clathrus columnatus]|uniref:WD40 repeat-like protein n=1 Tax=Clathrus columnatus TaxID=1419009 RepID=A0AAV5AHQ3_9AGAM|nr:hypothetical protein Clacol_006652 [Clathrus columnatus]